MKAIPCARYTGVDGIVRHKNQVAQDHASVGQIASAGRNFPAAASPSGVSGAAPTRHSWRLGWPVGGEKVPIFADLEGVPMMGALFSALDDHDGPHQPCARSRTALLVGAVARKSVP
jgi:hypothetical protein